jgi:hypothetical protein
VALFVCGLAAEVRGGLIVVNADSSRLVGGLTFTFNGQVESNDFLAGTLSSSFGGGSSFDTFCIDLYHNIYVGTNQYDVVALPIASFQQSPPSGSGAVGSDGAGIGWLFQTGEARLATESGPQAVIDGAGLQVALWKMAYDGDSASPTSPLDLALGNFQFLDSSNLGSNQHLVYASATSFLAGYDGIQSADATFLRVTDHGPNGTLYQDLVAPPSRPGIVPLVAVPESSSLALACAGVGAAAVLGLARRRAAKRGEPVA